MPRQVKGIRSYKLVNNVSDRCGGQEKSDTPSRTYWSTIKNRSYRQGRPQTSAPAVCNTHKIFHLYLRPNKFLG
jgi:hypothetical protein